MRRLRRKNARKRTKTHGNARAAGCVRVRCLDFLAAVNLCGGTGFAPIPRWIYGKRKINKNIPWRVVAAACRGIVVVALWIR